MLAISFEELEVETSEGILLAGTRLSICVILEYIALLDSRTRYLNTSISCVTTAAAALGGTPVASTSSQVRLVAVESEQQNVSARRKEPESLPFFGGEVGT